MHHCRSIAALALALVAASEPAQACLMGARFDPNDVSYADVVVVGRISNYKIVLDQEFRRKMLTRHEGKPGSILSDYARFDVQVDEVLAGKAPHRLSVTWDNSTFAEPQTMPAGPFLIALRDPRSRTPPLRGPSATILANPEPASLTVLQAPCAPPFILQPGAIRLGPFETSCMPGHGSPRARVISSQVESSDDSEITANKE